MAESETIKAELAAGLRDYLPGDMIPRQQMLDKIKSVFELFGFAPLDTPGLEREKILTGGDPNFKMQIFRAGLRGGNEDLALRFDLTVPLARVISQYGNEIVKPFKRYQVGKVWRGEKPQAGRFREFVQFDADIVGSSRTSADAEIVALIYETLTALGLSRFLIKFNNRKILNGLPAYAGFAPDKLVEILRLIDKLDRLGWENIAGEMTDVYKLSPEALAAVQRFLELSVTDTEGLLSDLRQLMVGSPVALEGVNELAEIATHLQALEIPRDHWTVDLSVARGLGYYTGPVFETTLLDLPSIGSVFSGGRFDDLVSRFGGGNIPATGASVGVDRLFVAMEKLNLVKRRRTIASVCVLNFDPDCEAECERAATVLRRAAISTEIYLGKEINLKGQLAHVVREEIPIAVLIGGNEKRRGVVKIKDMIFRREFDLPIDQAVLKIDQILKLLHLKRISDNVPARDQTDKDKNK